MFNPPFLAESKSVTPKSTRCNQVSNLYLQWIGYKIILITFIQSLRLQNLLPEFPPPFPSMQVIKVIIISRPFLQIIEWLRYGSEWQAIGEGTFSTVYLVTRKEDFYPESEIDRQTGKFRCRYALKVVWQVPMIVLKELSIIPIFSIWYPRQARNAY